MVLLIWPPVGRIFVHRFWFFGGVDPFWSFLDNFWYPAVLRPPAGTCRPELSCVRNCGVQMTTFSALDQLMGASMSMGSA